MSVIFDIFIFASLFELNSYILSSLLFLDFSLDENKYCFRGTNVIFIFLLLIENNV